MILLLFLILRNPQRSMYYALSGLNLWFTGMVPALLPFMILSDILVRLGLTERFAALFFPLVHPLWRVSKNGAYVMFMGFLCGFPMGAKVTAQLVREKKLTSREGAFLLAFCNNIGPVYFLSYVLPLLKLTNSLPYLIGMYGIPLLYGIFLQHTFSGNKSFFLPYLLKVQNIDRQKEKSAVQFTDRILQSKNHMKLQNHKVPGEIFTKKIPTERISMEENPHSNIKKDAISLTGTSVIIAMDEAVLSSGQSILILGGYMILFNLLNLLPYEAGKLLLLGERLQRGSNSIALYRIASFAEKICAPFLEITGGIGRLKGEMPLFVLLLLPLGGLCCLAQTGSCIRNTELSLGNYVLHKCILVLLTAGFYLGWYLLFPGSFLR